MGFSERQSLINYIHESNISTFENDQLIPYVSGFNIAAKWESEIFALSVDVDDVYDVDDIYHVDNHL